jgi:hypothetical protein
LRMPQGFMESDTLLMVLRNLLKAAHGREKVGEVDPKAQQNTTLPLEMAGKK